MKFDKVTVIVFLIGAGLILGWPQICRQMGWLPPENSLPAAAEPEKAASSVQPATGMSVADSNSSSKDNSGVEKKRQSEAAGKKTIGEIDWSKFPEVTIGNKQLAVTISPRYGAVVQTTLKNYLKADLNSDIVIGSQLLSRGALEFLFAGESRVIAVEDSRLLSPTEYLLKRRIVVGGMPLLLTQRWQMEQGYRINYRVAVKNLGERPITLPSPTLTGYTIPPLHQLTGDDTQRESHGVDYFTTAGAFYSIAAGGDERKIKPASPVSWFGVGNKYFAGIIRAEVPFQTLQIKQLKLHDDGNDKEYYTIMADGCYGSLQLAAGSAQSWQFTAFCGPKEFALLKNFVPQGERMLHLSWGPLNTIAEWLLQFLVWLNGKCGSYGWSIVILTIIVRLLFWPVTQKANRSMKKMQQLQPLVAELKEKYKDNPQLMNTKIMELYREKQVSPLGGCLPILLQIPVFFALYATLAGAVELRHVPFMWVADLSRPDTVATILGVAINPLVIAMTLLMIVQQKLTPMSGDPMQKKMMMFMPLIMLIFLYNLPAGLTLYWTVSQICSIFQLVITQKMDEQHESKATTVAT